jgi:hypothetical protein
LNVDEAESLGNEAGQEARRSATEVPGSLKMTASANCLRPSLQKPRYQWPMLRFHKAASLRNARSRTQ